MSHMTITTISKNTDLHSAQQMLFEMKSMEATANPSVFKALELAAQLYQHKAEQIALTEKEPTSHVAELLGTVGIRVAIVEGFNRVYKNTFQTVYVFQGEDEDLIKRLNMQDGDTVYDIAMAY